MPRKRKSATPQPKPAPPSEPEPAPPNKVFVKREGEPIQTKMLDELDRPIYLQVIPNMTPPGWEPIGGIASDSPEIFDAMMDYAHRFHYAGEVDALAKMEQARQTQFEDGFTAGEEKPAKYLLSWREILDAVGLKNNTENKRRVKELNKAHGGPIIPGGRGEQAKVNKDKLLEWWNGLEERFRESAQRDADAKATTKERYNHGRNGTVVPDIGGHVVKTRRKHSKT